MEAKSLGERIKELRTNEGLSLRQLAHKIRKSAPFISDVELGRRFPSDDVLSDIAKLLKVPYDELKNYDTRDSLSALKKMVASDPRWGFALRTAVEKSQSGQLDPEDLLRKLNQKKD